MSGEGRRFFDWTFADGTKLMVTIFDTHLATKDDSRRGRADSFSTSAERLLSEQSVPILGEANSQQLSADGANRSRTSARRYVY